MNPGHETIDARSAATLAAVQRFNSAVGSGPDALGAVAPIPEVNAPGLEGRFAPLGDGTALIWSDRPGGVGGYDLYVSARLAERGHGGEGGTRGGIPARLDGAGGAQ